MNALAAQERLVPNLPDSNSSTSPATWMRSRIRPGIGPLGWIVPWDLCHIFLGFAVKTSG